MGYLVAAFTVIWVITFAFILSIASRQRRLSAELDDVRAELERTME